jgi:hypothetical protein
MARHSTPVAVWLVVAATAAPAAVDALLGHSVPLLVLGRLALAAGVLRGARGFRVLLRVMSCFSMIGAVLFTGAAKGAWAIAGAEFVAALLAVVALGADPVRAWCPDPPDWSPETGEGRAAGGGLPG